MLDRAILTSPSVENMAPECDAHVEGERENVWGIGETSDVDGRDSVYFLQTLWR